MCTHLNRTGAKYYFRRPVPKDLLGYFQTATGKPRTEWKFSLGTADRESAKLALRPYELETDELIAEARQMLAAAEAPDAIPSAEEQRAQEEQDAAALNEEARKTRYEARRDLRTEVRARMMLSTAELSPQEAAWRDLVNERGKDAEIYRQAAQGQQAANDALAGRTSGRTLEALLEAYEADKSPRWSGSSKKAVVPVFRLLRDVFPGRDIGSITRDEARGVMGLLQSLPTNLGKRKELKGLTISQAVEKSRQMGLPTIAPKTINDGYLIHIAAVFNWAVKEHWVPSTPFSGLSVFDPVDDEDRRDPFTVEQLNTLFHSGLWSTPWQTGKGRAGDYWVPLLCLYHGLRNGEAAGLRVDDIGEEEGFPVLRIRPYEDQRLKTKESRGTLAIHPELLRLGFLEHVAHRRTANEVLMFPEGTANDRGQVGAKLGERFSDKVKALGLVGRKLGMHSFRHNFEDRIRAAELPERTGLALARRSEAGSSRIYGDGLSARQKADAIAKISYSGLDLSHLRPETRKNPLPLREE